MEKIHFVTGNAEKIEIAKVVCEQDGIVVEPVTLAVDEIQGEDPEIIVSDKAKRAYIQLEMPLVVSDDTWNIPALNGFPGPYMKSINHWFTPEDFLRLMDGIVDRTVILHQYLAFTDVDVVKVFRNDIPGKIIEETRGYNKKSPNMSVTALDADNGKTIAEVFELGQEAVIERYRRRRDVWHDFVEWYSHSHNS